jgi:UDP-sulfoquinovose synthase
VRVFIAGCDGYLGWPLAQHLGSRGHQVAGADLFLRRRWVEEMGGQSAIPIAPMKERLQVYRECQGRELPFREGDLRDYAFVEHCLGEFRPDAIVHLGEMPSAPYSMMDVAHATFTQVNNVTSTLNVLFAMRDLVPHAHLVKLGTMGEYGTPNVDIPEGSFEIEFRGRRDTLPFPRQAGSWYHLSKVHDSANVQFACRVWGLRSTDVMQGVVYGIRTSTMGDDPRCLTRLDFDQCFGTAINRFCCQAAIGEPITPYGRGGQKRGFIPLRDSIQCITLALENPPEPGEYRVLNQFEEVHDVISLAERVRKVACELGLNARIANLENPRKEMEEHYYNPDHQRLLDLGYQPTHDMESELRTVFADLLPHRERVAARRETLRPDIRWDGSRRPVEFVSR